MDLIKLPVSSRALDGLRWMLEAGLGAHELTQPYVSVEVALLITAVARRAPDRDEWFPRGKWATIQAIEGRIEEELDKITWKGA